MDITIGNFMIMACLFPKYWYFGITIGNMVAEDDTDIRLYGVCFNFGAGGIVFGYRREV